MNGLLLLRQTSARRWVLIVAAVCALVVVCLRAPVWRGGLGIGSADFIAYWSAARLAMNGGNPYDAAALLAVESAASFPRNHALMVWNPPWTLALTLPLASLSFDVATMAWLAVAMLLVLLSGLLLWDRLHPEDGRYWVGLLLSIGLCPSLLALYMGQISPWLLVGTAGFLWAERKDKDFAAGAALALLMIKPHVTYLFLLAALWWAWRDGRRRVLIGWLIALAGASALVLAVAPDVFVNYLVVVRNPPVGWHSATFGTWLRVLLGWQLSWLQFVPSLLGGLGLLAWLGRRRGLWRWEVLAPPLLVASVVTAAYGYSYDQVVLLPAVVALVGALSAKPLVQRVAILAALAASQVGLWAVNHWGVPDAFNVWHPPVLAGLYWWAMSGAPPRGETA